MDVQPSHRLVTSKPRSPVQASNFGSKSPVFKLPTELTMQIFEECRSFLGPPVILTHICLQWRQIAINGATLWTKICIQTKHPKQSLEHFSSLLAMQFDRTGALLLDVEWHAVVGDEYFLAALGLIREKAPFSRWKTLVVHLTSRPNAGAPWSSGDTFTSLESLIVGDRTENTLFGIIDCTVTSRLKVLQLPLWDMDIEKTFAKSLTHISSLRLHRNSRKWHALVLPANIENLRLDSNTVLHPLPYIRTYRVKRCLFYKDGSIDLQSMTTLIVDGLLTIVCKVVLPVLRELTLESLRLYDHAEIKSPALDLLHFTGDDRFACYDSKNIDASPTEEAFKKPGYLLSPNTSIIVDSHLSGSALILLLDKSPKATHVTFRFDDWADAKMVLERLVRTNSGFPRLSELRLEFDWRYSEPSESKEWLLDRLKTGRESGVMHPMSIYVSWKGEGAYVLLASD